jgi:hypothetical protein
MQGSGRALDFYSFVLSASQSVSHLLPLSFMLNKSDLLVSILPRLVFSSLTSTKSGATVKLCHEYSSNSNMYYLSPSSVKAPLIHGMW